MKTERNVGEEILEGIREIKAHKAGTKSLRSHTLQAPSAVNQTLNEKLDRSFSLTYDLFAHLDETSLNLDLPNLPSNRIAGQVWCVIGARESYTTAIETGGWQGFACSLATPLVKHAVLVALETTHRRVRDIDFTTLTNVQIDFAFDLLEHEIQHHGQLIRFVYGNGLTFPESWHKRYTV